jgi:hypothetical protein
MRKGPSEGGGEVLPSEAEKCQSEREIYCLVPHPLPLTFECRDWRGVHKVRLQNPEP